MYIHESLRYDELDCTISFARCEDIWIKIICPITNNIFIIGTTYRHPTTNVQNFLDCLNLMLMKLSDTNKHFFIFGDININTSPRQISSSGSDYINMLLSYGIASVIDKPSRITPSSATILDHILTNEDRFTIVPRVNEHDITDHYPAMVSISHKMDKNKYCSNAKFTLDLSTFSVDSFNEDLQIKLDDFMLKIPTATATNINSMFEDFYSLITTTIENHAPLKKLTRKQTRLRNKPWITKGLLKSIKRKQKMYKTHYINDSTDERKFYKSYCNTLTRIKTLTKKLFYKTQFDVHKHDSKKTWNTSRTLLPAKPEAQTPTSISVNSMSLSDPTLIAEAFNEYFARIGKTLINKFTVDPDNTYLSYVKHLCPSSLYLYPTTPAEIFRLITLLRLTKPMVIMIYLPIFCELLSIRLLFLYHPSSINFYCWVSFLIN